MIEAAVQPGVLSPVPRVGRYLFFSMPSQASMVRDTLIDFAAVVDGQAVVAGLGSQVVAALGAQVPGLREFPILDNRHVLVPSTPGAIWCWLRGEDLGELVLLTRRIETVLEPAFQLEGVVDGFRYGQGPNGDGRDLTGYEDGTENPKGAAALEAASVQAGSPGMLGSSFVAVQQWVHDFAAFEAMTAQAQDSMVGRRRCDNEEMDDAPESAHVKRTAQESFTPEAFVLRRSMPWAVGTQAGLMFVAFGRSFNAFEAQMRRMVGLDDGVVDALFQMSKPISGAYYWCPPIGNGRLDLRALEL